MGCLVAILVMAGSNICMEDFLSLGKDSMPLPPVDYLARRPPSVNRTTNTKSGWKYQRFLLIVTHSSQPLPFPLTRTCWKLFFSFLDFFLLPLVHFLRALFHQSFVIHTTRRMILPPLAAGGGIALVNVAALFLVAWGIGARRNHKSFIYSPTGFRPLTVMDCSLLLITRSSQVVR